MLQAAGNPLIQHVGPSTCKCREGRSVLTGDVSTSARIVKVNLSLSIFQRTINPLLSLLFSTKISTKISSKSSSLRIGLLLLV